jgi:hypothetical protein
MAERTASGTLAGFDGAHAALLRQSDLQFKLTPFKAPELPAWQVWLGKHLQPVWKALGPLAPYIFWGVAAAGAVCILYLIGQRLFGMSRGQSHAKFKLSEPGREWRPGPEQARVLLADADRLAADGLFVEAAHLILLRSIEDIHARRPGALAVSLTSRDIARAPALPPLVREVFSGIADAVEQSLFGGRPLDRDGFVRCRQAYEAFTRAENWA